MTGTSSGAAAVDHATPFWYSPRNFRKDPRMPGQLNPRLLAWPFGLAIALLSLPARANVAFNLMPLPGTPQFAVDGFTTAAGLWSAVLADDITVNIQIGFTALGQNVIAQAGSEFGEWSYAEVRTALELKRNSPDDYSAHASLQPGNTFNRLINHTSNNPNGPNSAIPYVDTMNRVGITTANAKALGLTGPSGAPDAVITFSSDFDFDFGYGSSISPGKLDFVGAAAHEIGHALGFVSGVDDIDTLGGQFPGGSFSSNLIDLFRYSKESVAAGPGYTDYTADNRLKYFSVDGGDSMIGAFSNGLVFGDGRQASHWKDFQNIGIMDPTANFGERLEISYTDLRMFDVIGFTLVPEPGSTILFISGLLVVVVRWFVCRQRAQ